MVTELGPMNDYEDGHTQQCQPSTSPEVCQDWKAASLLAFYGPGSV